MHAPPDKVEKNATTQFTFEKGTAQMESTTQAELPLETKFFKKFEQSPWMEH